MAREKLYEMKFFQILPTLAMVSQIASRNMEDYTQNATIFILPSYHRAAGQLKFYSNPIKNSP